MTADATPQDPSRPRLELPAREQILPHNATASPEAIGRRLTAAFTEQGLPLEPCRDLRTGRQELWYRTRLPAPFNGAGHEDACFIVAVTGRWTEDRADAFIADYAHLRTGPGLPRFRFYSEHPLPPELHFLFETPDAGLLEISAWELVESEQPSSDDAPALGRGGRQLLQELYGVELEPHDLQWISVAQQIIDEELRWFAEDPTTRQPAHLDYAPYAALLLLACVAGEAIRLNHPDDLLWADGDGDNLPRIGIRGKTASLAIMDAVFERFEVGARQDIWELYKVFSSIHHLPPPVALDAILIDPLEFLPSWDPEPDQPLDAAVSTFRALCAEQRLTLEPHPIAPEGDDARLLNGFLHAFACTRGEQRYDMFVATAPWTDPHTAAFIRTWGHRALNEWEIGANPVFVFFSGHPLTPLLEYCYIDGPSTGPLEGLARVETPAPHLAPDNAVLDSLALWLLHTLERYTTIGLDLDDDSILPGLEYFIREEVSQAAGAQAPADDNPHSEVFDLDHYGSYEPLALLVAAGLTAGESLRRRLPGAAWAAADGRTWPVLTRPGHPAWDGVEAARAIWRGEREEFDRPGGA